MSIQALRSFDWVIDSCQEWSGKFDYNQINPIILIIVGHTNSIDYDMAPWVFWNKLYGANKCFLSDEMNIFNLFFKT